jgi:hypothetical protein
MYLSILSDQPPFKYEFQVKAGKTANLLFSAIEIVFLGMTKKDKPPKKSTVVNSITLSLLSFFKI